MDTLPINLPTTITLSRILLIPLFVLAENRPLIATSIFLVAALTDLVDGYLARRSKQITKLGILLDPVADKLLIISALIVLVDLARIPAWMAIVIIAREFLITAMRVIALSQDIVIPAEMGGKAKTVTQIVAILLLLLSDYNPGIDIYGIGIVVLWIALVFTVASGIQYFIIFWRRL